MIAFFPTTCLWHRLAGGLVVLGMLPGCQLSPPAGQPAIVAAPPKATLPPPPSKPAVRLVEFFVDSTTIGQPRRHKLTIAQYQAPDSMYVDIHFYARQPGGWRLRHRFHFHKDPVTGLSPELVDYNHDGFTDFTCQLLHAARASNKVQRLFLYQPQQDQMLYVRNSEQYPNLRYNKQLRCLDAFLLHGGCATVFLNISADTLRPFARVELSDCLTVQTYDHRGKSRLLLRKPLTPGVFHFIRYKNYQPLQAYTDADF